MAGRGVARKTLDSAGGMQLAGGQTFVKVDGQLVVVLNDPVQPHGISPHDNPRMAEASSFFKIGGKRVCREGDHASCGHASTGAAWFQINA